MQTIAKDTNDFPEIRQSHDSCAGIGNVRLKGYVGARLDAMIANHVAATDPDYITAPFMEKTETRQWWQTEFWGKWMHAAVPFLVYSGDAALRDKIERGIERILASQEPCGSIGNYPDELRDGAASRPVREPWQRMNFIR